MGKYVVDFVIYEFPCIFFASESQSSHVSLLVNGVESGQSFVLSWSPCFQSRRTGSKVVVTKSIHIYRFVVIATRFILIALLWSRGYRPVTVELSTKLANGASFDLNDDD